MKIARTKIVDVRLIPESSKISEQEWIIYANNSNFLLARNLWSKDEQFQPKYFLQPNDKIIGVEFIWRAGRIMISYSKISSELVVFAAQIAKDLQANFYINDKDVYPNSKIIAAQKRLAKKSNESEVEFQKESFGGNNMWLAIRSSLEGIKEFYNLKGEEKPWAEALANMHACEGMFMYEFKGWTFIAGQKTDILFDCQVKGEEAIEKYHVDKLLKWGKTFSDVQLFMHYDRSIYFNAFYRVLNGEMIYGEYETESYQKKYGKMPKNVKDLPDSNANTVALEWSYEPDYLKYQKELENAAAWIVNIKDEA